MKQSTTMAEGMRERSDDDLVRDYLGGDGTAFDVLYSRYRARLFGFIRSMGLGRAEAEDLFQETWLRAIRGLRRYRPRGRFRTWLFKIARNAFLDGVRKHRLDNNEFEGTLASVTTRSIPRPDEELLRREQETLFRHAVESLPSEERQVLQLRTRENMSFREIAEILDIPLGTALWRMHSAVKRLAAFYREEEITRPGKRLAEGERT